MRVCPELKRFTKIRDLESDGDIKPNDKQHRKCRTYVLQYSRVKYRPDGKIIKEFRVGDPVKVGTENSLAEREKSSPGHVPNHLVLRDN